MDKRSDQLDAKVATTDADWAEADAADVIDFASWAVDNARLLALDALDARQMPTSSPRWQVRKPRGWAAASHGRGERPWRLAIFGRYAALRDKSGTNTSWPRAHPEAPLQGEGQALTLIPRPPP